MRRNFSIIIPCYNEAKRIEETIRAVAGLRFLEEIIVVDDGSDDETGALAAKEGARVIRLNSNLGKGAALNAGILASRSDILLFLDADLGQTAVEGEKLLLPVIFDQADMTIAKFAKEKKSGFGLTKQVAKLGVKYLGGIVLNEPISGQRAVKRELILPFLPLADNYGIEVDLNIKAAKANWRIQEISTLMRHRKTGRDLAGFRHRARQLSDIVQVFFR